MFYLPTCGVLPGQLQGTFFWNCSRAVGVQEVASLGAPLFALFEHPAPRLLEGVALVMRAVAQGGVLAAAPMREAALAEGALLSHLLLAVTQQVSHPTTCHLHAQPLPLHSSSQHWQGDARW